MRKLTSVLVVAAICGLAMRDVQGQVATTPVLVVVNSGATNPFGGYLTEILRAEGITAFSVAQLGSLDAPTLAGASLVLLAETALTPPQAALLTSYVNSGGRLVAMRPDPQLAPVLGITVAGGTTTDGYTLVDPSNVGAGLQAVTLPFKGIASHFTLNGATQVAALYTTRTTSSGRPAVVRHGRTAAWAFDLARSTAYTRQGDPALAGMDRDGVAPYRTTDIFYQDIDLERVALPHADIQMRLLSRVVTELLADALPLPRLWYFPGLAKTIVIPTGDSHVQTPASFSSFIAAVESVGARATIYLARFLDLSASPVAQWQSRGHEMSVHPVFNDDGIPGNFTQGYTTVFDWFAGAVPGTPGPTVRHHTLEWGGWVDPIAAMAARNIRMDFSYSAFGKTMHNPNQASQAHGYLNGSGLPMRFVNQSGQILPVFQQVTALADEQLVAGLDSEALSIPAALAVSRALIDASQAGGHSAIATNFHLDYYPFDEVKPWVDGTLAYAASLQIPMWTAQRWLQFVEARSAAAISNVTWNAATAHLSFTMDVPAGSPALSLMVPPGFAGRVLANVAIDGQSITLAGTMTVNGRTSHVVQIGPAPGGAPRQISIRYALASSLPVVSIHNGTVTEGNVGTTNAALTVSLSAPATTDVAVAYSTSNGSGIADQDYVPVGGGTVVIPAGALTGLATVAVIGDTHYEVNETVVVTLSNPLGATLGNAVGVLSIENDEPEVAVPDTYATGFRTPLTVPPPGVLANDDANGNSGLVAALVTSTANGTLTFNSNGGFSYTPNSDFAGPDTFTYRADTDGGLGNVVTVTINVAQPTNVQPARQLRVAAMNGNVVTFRWQPPRIGPPAAGYLLEGGVAPGQPLVALPLPPQPVFTIAAPTGSFYVRLRTLGAGGPSETSNEILAHINVPIAPSAPTGFLATSLGDAVHFAWTPTYDGGAPSAFVLDVSGSITASLPLGAVDHLSFAGAPPGSYSLSLRAVNAAGSSAASAAVPLTVPGTCGGPPGPPTNFVAYVFGGTTFVYWDQPTVGSAPTSYVITVPGIGTVPLAARSVSGQLPPGTYTIQVQALGPCGISTVVSQALTVP